jgi:hypothetical protein
MRRAYGISADRLGDVLDAMAAKWAVVEIELVPHLIVDGVRNANRTGLGERFEPRGDVYAIAEDIVAIDDDVAEIDPNPQLETTLRRNGLIDRKCGALHLDGAAERVDHTRKIGQQAVARRADNPPSMSSDQGVDGMAELAKRFVRSRFILAHEPAEPDHIRVQDGS